MLDMVSIDLQNNALQKLNSDLLFSNAAFQHGSAYNLPDQCYLSAQNPDFTIHLPKVTFHTRLCSRQDRRNSSPRWSQNAEKTFSATSDTSVSFSPKRDQAR